MHSLFVAVLQHRNLSKAGDLFSLEDGYVIDDLPQVLATIQQIITQPEFLTHHNDQSLVEICITRLTSAIRETETIESNAGDLVGLLETCLSYNLRPVAGGLDPPHAKIASDIMSCIFLNYSKKNVMQLALPVSVKFLHKGNKDLSRNMASYLSLAAIENAKLLGLHTQPIIDSVISGNYSLSRVLPQIYSVNPDPVKSHVMTLVSILANCENTEKLALLSLFASVAKDNAALLEPSIPQLCEGLLSSATAAATLQVLFNMALTRPSPLADHTDHLVATATNFPKATLLCIQVMSTIAKAKQEKAAYTLEFILSAVGRLESEKHSLALKEVVALTNKYPHLLTANLINRVSNLDEGGSATSPATRTCILELKSEFHYRSRERLTSLSSGVTVVSMGSRTEMNNANYQTYNYSNSRPDVSSYSYSAAAARSGNNPYATQQHRSMTRLNGNNGLSAAAVNVVRVPGSVDPRIALTKSMTRLNVSQQQQRLSAAVPARSRLYQQRTAAASPTKSMSSGSVTNAAHHSGLGATSYSTDGLLGGREVLTVNVNQINADLIRQVSSVLSHRDISGMALSQHPSGGAHHHHHVAALSSSGALISTSSASNATVVSSTSSVAPFSLPPQGCRRVPPYSSGSLAVAASSSLSSSQPPSLGIPLSAAALSSRTHIVPSANVPPIITAKSSESSAAGGRFVTKGDPYRGGGISYTLPSPRRRKEFMQEMMKKDESEDEQEVEKPATYLKSRTSSGVELRQQQQHGSGPLPQNRMSVFEPYPMRDTVQHFCEKHLNKIKSYMESLSVKLPLPVKCTIEERKGRKHAKLHFGCQGRCEEHCLYKSTFYSMKSRNPRTWIHLMFLALQSRSSSAISTRETSVSALRNCWDILKCESISFVTLVTGAFPPAQAQDSLLQELRSHRFFDVFEYNALEKHWGCFLCNHPDRAPNFVQERVPVIEGQLKEKKGGKWKIFKKWKSRYFTLSGAKLSYKEDDGGEGRGERYTHLDVGSIRSVKVSKEGRRNIPKAFEIFTADKTFILKAKDGSNALEWVQCLSVAKAHSQARDFNLRMLPHGGSLGRLNQHGRTPLQMRAYHNSATLNNQLFKTTAAV